MKLGYGEFLKLVGVISDANSNSMSSTGGKVIYSNGICDIINISNNKKPLVATKPQHITSTSPQNHKKFLDRLRINAELIFMIES